MEILLKVDTDSKGNVVARHIYLTEHVATTMIAHPTIAGAQITHAAFFALLQATPALRQAAGWNGSSQLPGEAAPKTHWQRLVEAQTAPNINPEFAALGLTE